MPGSIRDTDMKIEMAGGGFIYFFIGNAMQEGFHKSK